MLFTLLHLENVERFLSNLADEEVRESKSLHSRLEEWEFNRKIQHSTLLLRLQKVIDLLYRRFNLSLMPYLIQGFGNIKN